MDKRVGEAFEVFGERVVVRRDPSGGSREVGMLEELVPPGLAGPFHRHSREDEVTYVLEGRFRIWRGEASVDLGPGEFAFMPRNQIHTFRNIGDTPGRLLTVFLPGGLERYFQTVAARGLGPGDAAAIAEIAAGFGVEILGPPPDE